MESGDAEKRYRAHFDRTYGRRGYTFSRYLPAYRYGAKLLQQSRFANQSWSRIEEDIRRDWESRDAGPWPEFRDAVRYGWEATQASAQPNSNLPPASGTPPASGQSYPEGPHTGKRRL